MNPREYEIMFSREDTYWWYRGMRRVTRAFAPGLFSANGPARTLDAGCGTGRNLSDLAAGRDRPVGLDVSFRALGYARLRGSSRLVCGTLEALPFRTESFGAALSRDVLYMIARDDAAAAELARVLSAGGVLVVSSPAFAGLAGAHDRAVGGLRRYTIPSLTRLLSGAGLVVSRATYANFFLSAPIWLLRKATGALARGTPSEAVASEFGLSPPFLDRIFYLLLALEGRLVTSVSLPFGTTVFARAEKPLQGRSVAGK